MGRSDAIKVEATVVGRMAEKVWQVELANGHRLAAFMTRRKTADERPPELGDKVIVEVSPFDLSKGRIVGNK